LIIGKRLLKTTGGVSRLRCNNLKPQNSLVKFCSIIIMLFSKTKQFNKIAPEKKTWQLYYLYHQGKQTSLAALN
jgi:hypothetical protein